MSVPYDPTMQWNIFARELERLLQQRGLTITRLDDLKVVTHPMKIKRLKASLASPQSLTTLNPEEMERLQETLQLSPAEQTILRAALLATAVERTLMDRIDPYLALMAANDVYRLIAQAMQRNPESHLATAPKQISMNEDHTIFGDPLFEEALDLNDRASLAMHLSQAATTLQARITHAREAYDAYSRALATLQRSAVPTHDEDDWRACEAEILHGQTLAGDIMRRGGETI